MPSEAWKSTKLHVFVGSSELVINWIVPHCRKLKRLNLGGNELTAVPQKALSLLENLRKLEIQENRIRDIKEGDFEGE